MNITITINTDNAAFQDFPGTELEVANILRELGNDIKTNDPMELGTSKTLFDTNGNRVGHFIVTES